MSSMLTEGDKLLISHRRLFERDELRYFAGEVAGYDDGVVKVVGWTYLKDFGSGKIIRKKDPRTKLYSLASGTILVYQLPEATNLDSLEFVGDPAHLLLTDDDGLHLNLSERAGDSAAG
jgi:hypothetical protein